MRFAGKTVIVTGAASGVGLAVARLMAREGAEVVLGDWNSDGLEKAAAAIGDQAMTYQLDVSDPMSCKAMIDAAVSRTGQVDVLCNIAGILELSRLADLTPERLMRVLSVNLAGAFYLTQAAMPHLVPSRGNVVNVASVVGLVGGPFQSAYSATKHGIVGMTKSLALEFAEDGVRINAVCPTGIKTPMFDAPLPEGVDEIMMERTSPWLDGGEFCDPEDVADAVAFLASTAARRITGIALPVDGGESAA